MALTEKMKAFCREYIANGGNGTQAYISSYDWNGGNNGAEVEARALLKREDVNEYLKSLVIPLENKVISEREKKRSLIWERIDHCVKNGNDAGAARWMDILNKMDSEYININKNVDDTKTAIDELDVDTLRALASPVDESNGDR